MGVHVVAVSRWTFGPNETRIELFSEHFGDRFLGLIHPLNCYDKMGCPASELILNRLHEIVLGAVDEITTVEDYTDVGCHSNLLGYIGMPKHTQR